MGGKGAFYKEKYGGGRSQFGGRDGGGGDSYGGGCKGGGGDSYGGGFKGAGGDGYGGGYKGGGGESYGGGFKGGGGGFGKGGGRGRGGGDGGVRATASKADLVNILRRIDGKPYGAYRDLEGASYDFGTFRLIIQHVQSDPFAPPSRCYVTAPLSDVNFPSHCFANPVREVAFRDYITRRFFSTAQRLGLDKRTEAGGWSGQKGGEVLIDQPGQHVLDRSSVVLDRSGGAPLLEARFTIALPARGRSVLGEWASQILAAALPDVVNEALYFQANLADGLRRHLDSVEDQRSARAQLFGLGLVAFVANGSILPRASGASDLPMSAAVAVPFASPPELQVAITVPNAGVIEGMGVRRGVSIIVGGGFHGKSTLLEAIQVGVYDKIPGDGRERVVTDENAVKVRAEDGRAVTHCDISPFIDNLPFGKRTSTFSSEDASGSTSQAAAIIEALEAGCTSLLIDEDTSATNFMIRDARMQALVAADKEPIRPFISKVRSLWSNLGVSSIVVIGGSGDYFDVADSVIMLDNYAAADVTARAKQIAQALPRSAAQGDSPPAAFVPPPQRCPSSSGLAAGIKTVAMRSSIRFGDLPELDLSGIEQIVELSQVRAIAEALLSLAQGPMASGEATVADLLQQLTATLDAEGLDALRPSWRLGNLARPRPLEIAASLSRLRSLSVSKTKQPRA